MNRSKTYKTLITLIASVWIVNGLFCKILNLVPRHKEIVSRILSDTYSNSITITIGVLELMLALWVLTNYKSKLKASIQIIVLLIMNIIEFITVPDVLLWGRFNIIFALAFISLIHYTYFIYKTDYVSIS